MKITNNAHFINENNDVTQRDITTFLSNFEKNKHK